MICQVTMLMKNATNKFNENNKFITNINLPIGTEHPQCETKTILEFCEPLRRKEQQN